MIDSSPQPTVGSLSARIIRACPVHPTCELDCPERQVEDLGEIATFASPPVVSAPRPSLARGIAAWLEQFTHRGGT